MIICSASKVKCPSLLTDFNLTSFASSACAESAMSHPTAMRGELHMIICSASKVKCPSLLTDFNLISVASSACAESAMSQPTAMREEIERENFSRIKSNVPFTT
jgi:hypothetical protein